jgi:hypothetical protein
MVRLQQNQFLIGLAVIFTAVVLAAGWYLHGNRRTAQAAALVLAQKQRECRRLGALNPPPTAAQAAAIEADLARTEGLLAALREEFWNATPAGFGRGAAGTPTSRTDAFFDLTGFVKSMREQAERAGVNLRAEEQFGFSAYAHEGPAPGLIAAIQRQRQVAAWLLEALFAAHPRQLLAVQRTQPPGMITPATSPARQPGGVAPAGAADDFDFDPRLSLRDPDVKESAAFRLTFTGHTATLRRFLNRLAAGDLPVVVCSVAVEPVLSNPLPRKGPPGGPDPSVQAVRPALSRFAVTVESCELAGPPAPASGARRAESGQAGLNGGPRRWVEPAAQRRGPGWIYDVFTPPAVHFDQRSGTLTATPAPELVSADADEVALDLELLEVRRELSRLQLVGYAGGPEDRRGIFLDLRTGETLIGHAGDRLAGCGFSVKRLVVTRAGAGFGDGAATGEPVAVATVADETTGNDVVLTSCKRCWLDAPLALFASRKTPGFRRELRVGESVALNGASYCIEHIDLDPPSVVVATVAAAGAVSAFHTLTPQRPPVAAAVTPAPTATERSIRSFPSKP